jgi:hypothetical protein
MSVRVSPCNISSRDEQISAKFGSGEFQQKSSTRSNFWCKSITIKFKVIPVSVSKCTSNWTRSHLYTYL